MQNNFIPFKRVTAYQNDDVILRYQQDFPESQVPAKVVFREMLKFLWCVEKHRDDHAKRPNDKSLDFKFYMHAEMKEIDDMWHTFILFTRDYHTFCHHFFDHYIHHSPTTSSEKTDIKENFEQHLHSLTQKQLSYVYDHLGADTLKIWFSEYFKEEAE